jgi:RNA-directed DNA polymerase
MPSSGEANGPKGRTGTTWDAIDWRKADRIVRNLRHRIFRASQANDLRKGRSLQKARRMHPNKPKKWRKNRYWGRLNPERDDRWVFGDKHTGAYLLKFRWFKIVRHPLVRGQSSPDDPGLRDYWWARRKINFRCLSASDVRLAERQDWRCPVCGMDLINGEELHRHHKRPRRMGGSDAIGNREIVRLYCHQQRHAVLRKEHKVADRDERLGP